MNRIVRGSPFGKNEKRSVAEADIDRNISYGMHFMHLRDVYTIQDRPHLLIAPLPHSGIPVTAGIQRKFLAIRPSDAKRERAAWKFVEWIARQDPSTPLDLGGFPCNTNFLTSDDYVSSEQWAIQGRENVVLAIERSREVGEFVYRRSRGLYKVWSELIPIVRNPPSDFTGVAARLEDVGNSQVLTINP